MQAERHADTGAAVSLGAQELAQARQTVESERARYTDLFHSAPDGYLVTDMGAVIIEANRAAAGLLGVEDRFLKGKPIVTYVDEPARVEFLSGLGEVVEGRRRDDWRLPLRPRGGQVIHVSITVSPARWSPGAARALDGPMDDQTLRWILRDVSLRARDERRIEQLNADLEQRVAERTAEVSEANRLLAQALARSEELSRQLQQALSSRIVIEQAKGRLMERQRIDAETAFQALRAQARSANRKLHEVAQEIVDAV